MLADAKGTLGAEPLIKRRVKPLRSREGMIARSPQANWGLKYGPGMRGA